MNSASIKLGSPEQTDPQARRLTWLMVIAIALVGAIALVFYDLNTPVSARLNFDSSVHISRALRVRNLIIGNIPENMRHKKLLWSVLIGPNRDIPRIEGNVYPPGVSLLTGSILALFGSESISTSIAIASYVSIIFFVLLIISTGGFCMSLGRAPTLFACIAVAASPLALLTSSQMLLDIPLAGMTALTFWLLIACDSYRSRTLSVLLGLTIAYGCLIKPTYWCFTALPIILSLIPVARDAFSGWKSRTVLGITAFGSIFALYAFSKHIDFFMTDLKFNDQMILTLIGKNVGATLLAIAFVYFINKPRVVSPITHLSQASPLQRFTNGTLTLLISGLMIAIWYLPMLSCLSDGFMAQNATESSGLNKIPAGTIYYLTSIVADLLPSILVPFAAIGLFIGIIGREYRWKTALSLGTIIVSILLLSIFGGRLSRYMLPLMLPLGWLVGLSLAPLKNKPKLQIVPVVLMAIPWIILSFSIFLQPLKYLPSEYHWNVYYRVWGDITEAHIRETPFCLLALCITAPNELNKPFLADPDLLFAMVTKHCNSKIVNIFYSNDGKEAIHGSFIRVGLELAIGSNKKLNPNLTVIEHPCELEPSDINIYDKDLNSEVIIATSEPNVRKTMKPNFVLVDSKRISESTYFSILLPKPQKNNKKK